MNHATPTAWKRTDVFMCWACVEPPRWTNEAPPGALFHISFSRQRPPSTVPLGKSRCTVRQCSCNQHRKSALPTTKTCESCHSQSRSRPGDVSFHVDTWTRRTTKQCFQQPILACRVAVVRTTRATCENRQSNTMPNNVVKRVQSFVRNQFKRLLASDLACPSVLLTPLRSSSSPTFSCSEQKHQLYLFNKK